MFKRWIKSTLLTMMILMSVLGFVACNKVEFKIDFIVDDVVYATVETNGEEVIKMPEDPDKEGYVFEGWYWDEGTWEKAFTANSLLDAPLSSNMRVYAKFIVPHEHEYATTVITPSCENEGYTIYKCACGEQYTDDIVPATGHTYNKKVLDEEYLVSVANCTTPETYHFSCACGKEGDETFTVGSALEHRFTTYISDGNATTEADGTKTAHCDNSGCNATDTVTDIGSKLPISHTHSYTSIVTYPTCTEQGFTTHTCGCGDSYVDAYVRANGHSYDNGLCKVCGNPAPVGSTGLVYTLSDDKSSYEVAGIGTCTDSDIIIPSMYDGKAVTGICENAFNNCGSKLKSITIPNTITRIGNGAFANCLGLTSVTFEEGCRLTHISNSLFFSCSNLVSIKIPSSVVSIGANAFYWCNSLTEISFEGSKCWYVTKTEGATSGTYISLNNISQNATYLRKTYDDYYWYANSVGHNYDTVLTSPTCTEQGYITYTCINCGDSYIDNYVKAAGHSFTNYVSDGNATVESDGTKTAHCDNDGCNATDTITDVGSKLPDTHMHSYTSVVTQPTCTQQGFTTHTCGCGDSYVDAYTDALNHNEISHEGKVASCMEIGWEAYVTCSRCDYSTYKEIPAGHNYVNNVCTVCGNAYASKGLVFATFRSGYAVTGIGDCSDTTIVIPSEYNGLPVIAIAEGAFKSNQKIIEVIVPDSVLLIEDEAFSYSKKLTKVVLGNGVVEIGMSFAGCDGLTTIKIPASVTTIDTLAFYLAKNMECIEVDDGNNVYSSLDGILYNKDKTILEYCPPKIAKADIVVPSTVTTISSYSFVDCVTVKTITMSNGVQIIENSAFSKCKNLESIVMSNNITKIQNYAFEGCSSLKSFVVPNGVTWIYPYVFRNCTSLEWIYISKNIEMIYYDPFEGCSALKTVYFGGTEAEWNAISYSDSVPSYVGINFVFEYDMSCNHEITVDKAVEPTCTAIGLTEGSHCSICGTVLVEQKEIPMIAHTEEVLPSRVATCSEVGLTEGLHCSMCKTVFVKQDEIPKKPHTPTIILPYVEPTCSSFGWTEGKQCSVCGEIAVAQEMINKTAHNYIDGICDACGHEYCSAGITFQKYGSYNNIGRAAFVTGYTGTDTEVYIPSYTDGYVVIGIDSNAFKNNTKITKVKIPETVTSIGPYAFYGCSKLVSVNIPNAVTSLSGYSIFMGCSSLKSIVIPNSVKELGDSIFQNCSSLESVVLSNQITKIPLQAFLRCSSLAKITLPASVTQIRGYGFGSCSSLTEIEILGDLTTIGYGAFSSCLKLEEFTIPKTVYYIDNGAFSGCDSLKSIVIPSSVTTMSYAVFRGCDLLTIYCESEYAPSGWDEDWNDSNCPVVWGCATAGDYITSDGIKWEINSSNKVTIVDFVVVIDGTFSGSKLTIPSQINGINVTEIAAYAFDNYSACNKITELVIPSTVTTIGEYAFTGFDTLQSVTIPSTLASIGNAAFNCDIDKVIFNGTKDEWLAIVDIIGDNNESLITAPIYTPSGQMLSFDDVKYLRYTLNSDGTSYCVSGAGAFNGTSLTIPSTYNGKPVTSIGSKAFYKCSNLQEITIPSSIKTIESSAFAWCENIEKVNVAANSSLTTIGNSAFSCCTSLKSFVVPANVTSLGDEAFSSCGSLNEFTFASNTKIKSIGQYCFTDCNGLMSITIPSTVTSIGERAFWYCYKLIEVYNLSSLSIVKGNTDNGYTGYYALYIYTSASTTSKLTTTSEGFVTYYDSTNSKYYLMGYRGDSKNLELPSKINNKNYEVYKYAFANTNIESVSIPASVTAVGVSAFKYCEKLATVTFATGFTGTIGDSAFMECNSLTTFTIPAGIKEVDSYIYRCHSLETIYVPSTVTKLDMYAFAYNENLKSIYFDGTKAQWNAIEKWRDWDLDTGNYTVYCSDGTI